MVRAASAARDVVAVVFTGVGDKAFCTGGNTKEYAEYYAGQPQEYRQYMRLFNDMVSTILACDKPVICRVNGMRIGGGQEIGMACDFSVAQDLARFGKTVQGLYFVAGTEQCAQAWCMGRVQSNDLDQHGERLSRTISPDCCLKLSCRRVPRPAEMGAWAIPS